MLWCCQPFKPFCPDIRSDYSECMLHSVLRKLHIATQQVVLVGERQTCQVMQQMH